MIGIALPQLLTSLVSFAILLFLLYRFLYAPLSRMMRERSQKIKDSLEAADKARAEAADAGDKIEQDIKEARKQAAEIIADARVSAQKFAERENERARRQVEETLKEAQADMERQKATLVAEVRQEFSELALLAAERIVRAKLDRKTNQNLIESVLDEAARQRDNAN